MLRLAYLVLVQKSLVHNPGCTLDHFVVPLAVTHTLVALLVCHDGLALAAVGHFVVAHCGPTRDRDELSLVSTCTVVLFFVFLFSTSRQVCGHSSPMEGHPEKSVEKETTRGV